MKIITAKRIQETAASLSIRANFDLRGDVLSRLKSAYLSEKNKRAKKILKAILENAAIAHREKLAICQDTGMPVVFLELGRGIIIRGDLRRAVNKGVELGYKKGFLRNSIVNNPLERAKPGYLPVIIHTEIVPGNKLKITVLPKGFGCENKSQLKMFKPTASLRGIKNFIIDSVKSAGPDACPPYVLGVGIGGTADYACLLAKRALLRPTTGGQRIAAKLERDLLKELNKLNIGPMGLGGKNTVLAVNILTFPTHIAGLPVAVNISCHALRSAAKII